VNRNLRVLDVNAGSERAEMGGHADLLPMAHDERIEAKRNSRASAAGRPFNGNYLTYNFCARWDYGASSERDILHDARAYFFAGYSFPRRNRGLEAGRKNGPRGNFCLREQIGADQQRQE
jgi:hypothetical protein